MGHGPLLKRSNGAFLQVIGCWPLQIIINEAKMYLSVEESDHDRFAAQ